MMRNRNSKDKERDDRQESETGERKRAGASASHPKKLTPLSHVLPGLYAGKQWQRAWFLFQLSQNWPRIVGEQVALLTRPAWLRHDVLWIYVQNSAWVHHIQMVKLDMLERIGQAQEGLSLSDLRCLIDPLHPSFRPGSSAADQAPTEEEETGPRILPEQTERIRQLTEAVGDAECRRALAALWRRWCDK